MRRGEKIEPNLKIDASFFYWTDVETGGVASAVAWAAGEGLWESRMALRLSSALISTTS